MVTFSLYNHAKLEKTSKMCYNKIMDLYIELKLAGLRAILGNKKGMKSWCPMLKRHTGNKGFIISLPFIRLDYTGRALTTPEHKNRNSKRLQKPRNY